RVHAHDHDGVRERVHRRDLRPLRRQEAPHEAHRGRRAALPAPRASRRRRMIPRASRSRSASGRVAALLCAPPSAVALLCVARPALAVSCSTLKNRVFVVGSGDVIINDVGKALAPGGVTVVYLSVGSCIAVDAILNGTILADPMYPNAVYYDAM